MRKLFALALFLTSATIFAQGTITGTVIDSDMNAPLPGANVLVVGTDNGTTTDFDGNFTLNVQNSTGTIEITFIGYERRTVRFNVGGGQTQNLGRINLNPDAGALEEVIVVGRGVIDVAIGRQTPVAVSTITANEIERAGGNLEFPELLATTPSVYANPSGGGYGDSEIRVRGFDQSNTAFLLNGQPINGMEDGRMYWSNWQGVRDIANAIQIQRGLGASKLAISSVGGTVNIITQTYNNIESGYAMSEIANGNFFKNTGYYTTGQNDLGWSSTYMLSYWQGDGNFYDATSGKGLTYFFSVGYKPSDAHAFNFLITGAPQTHGQAFQGSIARALEFGRTYNENWGYRDGEVYNERVNFYHKPVMNFNWDWNISEKSDLSTVLYASTGTGGGTGPLGRYNGTDRFDENRQLNFDAYIANNENLPTVSIAGEDYRIGNHPDVRNAAGTGYITRASMNNHWWVGGVSNFNHKVSDNLEFNLGTDVRYYHGDHYRQVVDFLGLDAWYERGNRSIPNGQPVFESFEVNLFSPTFERASRDQHIGYSYSENIGYIGGFGQVEYKTDRFSAFLQGALSTQSHQRFDYFNYLLPEDQSSEVVTNEGYNIKGGLNYNINDQHNIFGNVGYYSRQPFHDNIYLNFQNDINPLTTNEDITGVELGYGFDSNLIEINVNTYWTKWGNRSDTRTSRLDLDEDGVDEDYFATFNGIEQTHYGVELDFVAKPTYDLTLTGFVSLGNWEYSDNPVQRLVNADDLNPVPGLTNTISYVDGEKVGNAPQTTVNLGARYNLLSNLNLYANWWYYADLYANIDPVEFSEPGQEVVKLPNYDLVNVGATYRLPLGGNQDLTFRGNVRNLFNEVYITSLQTNRAAGPDDETYKGINVANRGFFGFDRQWSLSVKYSF